MGATVPCYVAPDGRAILEHASPFIGLLVLFPMIFVAIGAVGLVVTWKPKRRDASGAPVDDPISQQARPGTGSWAMTIFGAIFATVGAALLWPTAMGPALGVWQARDWPAERCTVERSEVLELIALPGDSSVRREIVVGPGGGEVMLAAPAGW